eukprot:13900009-Ditylum_brightwellii.AAC.1
MRYCILTANTFGIAVVIGADVAFWPDVINVLWDVILFWHSVAMTSSNSCVHVVRVPADSTHPHSPLGCWITVVYATGLFT